jgi:hypothetical protein
MLARRDLADYVGVLCGRAAQDRRLGELAVDGLGVMRRDYAAGERDVGEVLAVGVEAGVRRVRRAGKREFVSAGGRRPALAR